LGASPGASTAVVAMIDVLKKCFSAEMKTPEWKNMLKLMTPSYGAPISKANRCQYSREVRQKELGLIPF
jgi:malate dehydrogenase (quinone)